ncbi:PREDICTED: rab3 GTPase-activating protein catalytic subunit-like [Amphimedon queenslandica]|uniref:Uncharacterized protein n=2 Tax=Amphimedon queenslandica TaxID=400682 RepID=A0AAN0K441_AMPQE|nr:PREDICTED: rab3 GTPase-activating protein catalytic subunit-like [Amphimedon queenslandica]|eukprot:XP_019864079.1 PREDICTED: rab3 GTPase-activating protein catalytic subunit-like [Amphimedon queenslandica]
MFSGQCEGCGLRTCFEMIHLRHIPPHFSHLSGLLNLFRSKLNGVNVNPPDINIAARLTYCLRHWNVEDWPVGPLSSGDGSDCFLSLPVGASSDPIQEIHLCAVWPLLTELTVTDNETNSGFDPFNAPKWSIRTQLLDNPGLLLSKD